MKQSKLLLLLIGTARVLESSCLHIKPVFSRTNQRLWIFTTASRSAGRHFVIALQQKCLLDSRQRQARQGIRQTLHAKNWRVLEKSRKCFGTVLLSRRLILRKEE